ncbi:MAG: hypothetical protein ABIA76_04940 [Candidatus Diapherotrites archaeon]
MECVFMNKGQITFEFIMLIMVLLFFIITVINPTAEEAKSSVQDVQRVSNAVTAGEKLASAINYAASAGEGTKIPLNVFLPEGSKIDFDAAKKLTVTAYVNASEPIQGCEQETSKEGYNQKCMKEIKLLQTADASLIETNLNALNEAQALYLFVEKQDDTKVTLTKVN